MEQFEARRSEFSKAIGNAIAVVAAAGEATRNYDVEHEFRQDSDFFFLTGFDEPDAVAVINPSSAEEPYVLFVRPRDREMEIWNGYRAGVEGAVERFGAAKAYPLSELAGKLREYLIDSPRLFVKPGSSTEGTVSQVLGQLRAFHGRSGRAVPFEVHDPSPQLHELRLIKSEAESEALARACAISAEAHAEAMRIARPGLGEYQVQAALEYVFRMNGSARNGYPSIVASGPNACVLHYTENRRVLEDGDLLLIDAGAEYGYHSADITRTFPVSGSFSVAQRAIYEVVLAAEQAGLAASTPGGTLTDVHDAATKVIAEGLVDLQLVPKGLEDTLAMHHYNEFFMHGTSHWLGMDVHDAGSYRVAGEPRRLQPGMAFTVEPGVYVDPERASVQFSLLEYDRDEWTNRRLLQGAEAKQLEAEEKEAAGFVEHEIPTEFRGIGIRIEDDVIITAKGHENLTAEVPTAVDAVEALCQEHSRLPVI